MPVSLRIVPPRDEIRCPARNDNNSESEIFVVHLASAHFFVPRASCLVLRISHLAAEYTYGMCARALKKSIADDATC